MEKTMNTSPKLKIINGHAYANSLDLAKQFNKSHDRVLKDIRKAISEVENDFGLVNFDETSRKDKWNREQPVFNLTKDGFAIVAMSFTGIEAMKWKVAYLKAFNSLERELSQARKRIETLEQLEMFPEMLREREYTIAEALEKIAAVGLFTSRTSPSWLKAQIKNGKISGRYNGSRYLIPESGLKGLLAA
jgi:Rha family phage regulatory protein